MLSTFGNTADISAIVNLVPHACQHITFDQSHSSGDRVAKTMEIIGEWKHKDSVLHKPPQKEKSHWAKSGAGVATALTRHILFLYVLSTFVESFD